MTPRRAIQIVDLGFGDAGKGTMVDYLVRRHDADLVVRFNGGPQAGHNVVLPDGRHHTFSQFGSGSFVPHVRTLLSRFMLIEPYAMLNEAQHLNVLGVADVLNRTLIDERALVITPLHQVANRIREKSRESNRHGTCGMGVGECVRSSIHWPAHSISVRELGNRRVVRGKLLGSLERFRGELRPILRFGTAEELRVLDDPEWIDTAVELYSEIARSTTILSAELAEQVIRESIYPIFEGAQGVLLDETHGFHPHTTWSTTTFQNADVLLDESRAEHARTRIGVCRTYMTRHGEGPFVTANDQLQLLTEPHNTEHGWQGPFRRGVLDLVMLRYALSACEMVDSMAITHLDRLRQLPKFVCDRYAIQGSAIERLSVLTTDALSTAAPIYSPFPTLNAGEFTAAISERLNCTIAYQSFGPAWTDKLEC